MHGIVDQEKYTGEAQRHSPRFLEGDGLAQKQESKNIVKIGPRVPRIPVSSGVAIVIAERKES